MKSAPLFLTAANVAALAISIDDATTAVERALVDAAASPNGGRSIIGGAQPSASFQATTGIAAAHGVAGVKWISVAADSARQPRVSGVIVVNDYESGVLSGIVDAATIVALRTAAETVIAARRLARADSARIGFVACGRQALAHLDALASAFPLAMVHAHSATGRGAERLARSATTRGIAARVVDRPRDAIEGMDVIVSSVPFAPDAETVADARWIAAGTFVAFLDFARRWSFDASPFDVVAVDDDRLLRELSANGRATMPAGPRVELAALIGSTADRRASTNTRTAFVQCGVAAGDLALADVALRRALARGVGTPLGAT